MRVVFVSYVLLIAIGLAIFIVIGLLGR